MKDITAKFRQLGHSNTYLSWLQEEIKSKGQRQWEREYQQDFPSSLVLKDIILATRKFDERIRNREQQIGYRIIGEDHIMLYLKEERNKLQDKFNYIWDGLTEEEKESFYKDIRTPPKAHKE